MRVMLVYSNRTRILEPTPPIGLSYIATATRRAGHEVRFVDMMMSRNPDRDMRSALAEFKPDVVGISVRNIDNVVPQRLSCHLGEIGSMIATIRELSKARIVLGGPAISILKSSSLERFDADFAISGEGENAFPQLLIALGDGQHFSDIAGLSYRENAGLRFNNPQRLASFGSSGMENWVNWKSYERGGGTWAIHTKRGCPLHCLYCNYPGMEGHELRRRSASDIADEIESVQKTVNPRTFEFTDSIFNIPPDHAVEICEEIIRRKLKVRLSAIGMNPLGMTEELINVMERAGFISMVVTPDSASETMLANLRKGFTTKHILKAAELARKSNIRSTWFFLLGGPGETEETAEQTVSFVEQHLNWNRCLTIFMTGIRILPGTDLAKYAVAEGLLSPDSDLVESTFYFSPQLSEQWVLDRINRAISKCPTIVHGAEETGSVAERFFNSALHWLGVAPPYWRFLPTFLSIPPLPFLRARSTGVPVSRKSLFVSPLETRP